MTEPVPIKAAFPPWLRTTDGRLCAGLIAILLFCQVCLVVGLERIEGMLLRSEAQEVALHVANTVGNGVADLAGLLGDRRPTPEESGRIADILKINNVLGIRLVGKGGFDEFEPEFIEDAENGDTVVDKALLARGEVISRIDHDAGPGNRVIGRWDGHAPSSRTSLSSSEKTALS